MAQTLTWPVMLTWRAGPARMRRSTQGHMVELARPTRRAGGASGVDTWQGSTWVHVDARVRCHVARGAGNWRAHGLVGPGYKIGEVTQ